MTNHTAEDLQAEVYRLQAMLAQFHVVLTSISGGTRDLTALADCMLKMMAPDVQCAIEREVAKLMGNAGNVGNA